MKAGDRVIIEKGEGQSEMLGSSFFAFALPIQNKTELEAELDSVRSMHHKANHLPYGFRLDEGEGFSEDGEPSGSSGRPLLEFMRSENAYGLLVVARYFGGTKLGVGNLRRMVLEAGKMAFEKATVKRIAERCRYPLSVSYSEYDSLTRLASRLGFTIEQPEFGEVVTLYLISDTSLPSRLESKGFLLGSGEPFLTLVED